MKILLTIVIIFLFDCIGFCSSKNQIKYDSLSDVYETNIMPHFIYGTDSLKSKNIKSKGINKLTAAILSFPLPFGILGLHRIYFGTKPYVPFFYIGTLGGCVGILPLIDFVAILTTHPNKLERFENCNSVFMWTH